MTAVDPGRAHRKVNVGSSRSFGFVFAGFFALAGLLPLLRGHDMRLWALALSGLFLAAALFVPRLLRPLNLLWFWFGLMLHAVVNPIVMSLIYWISVVPVGLVMRAAGKDPLRLARDPDAASYWIPRD
ncbi:MAG: SxtJ family membrane protein, partial [Phenylobacterium sp.]